MLKTVNIWTPQPETLLNRKTHVILSARLEWLEVFPSTIWGPHPFPYWCCNLRDFDPAMHPHIRGSPAVPLDACRCAKFTPMDARHPLAANGWFPLQKKKGPLTMEKSDASSNNVGNQALHLGTRDDTCKLKHWTCRFRGHPSRRMTARPTDRAGSSDDPFFPRPHHLPKTKFAETLGKWWEKCMKDFEIHLPDHQLVTSWISCVFWSFQLWPSSFASQPDGFGIEQEVPQPCPGFTGPKIPHAFP